MEILSVEINPSTQGSVWYVVGKNTNIVIDGKESDSPQVSSIEVHVSEKSNNVVITVKVNGETYCIYENVPYALYYKTTFHS